MRQTLIEGLTSQMIQARINTFDAKPFLFGTHFPVKKVNGFNWKMLANQLESANVAADVHTDNGTILRKRRPLFETAQGDIPFISISREMKRSEIKEYQTAMALAQNADASALVDYWGNDVDFTFRGVQSELEYIAWKLASNAGRLHFDTTNNATFANEFDLDYFVADEAKLKTASDWSDTATADVLGDLSEAVKTAKALGANPKVAFVNLKTFYDMVSSEQVIKACASYASNALGVAQTPDLAALNAMLARKAWLNGLQVVVIDQTITREFTDGTRTSGNPFEDNRVILAESPVLGSTQYDILIENSPVILRAVRTHTVVKKWAIEEPLTEITMAHVDGIPVFDSVYRNVYLRTDAQEWDA